MIAKYSANGQPYDSPMAAAVRAVALRHEPVEHSSFYIHPASVKRIRKLLFRLLDGPAQEAALARRCLIAIDILRDEHGIAADDTRHPNVLSDAPWPPETIS